MEATKGYRILVVEDEGLIALDIAKRVEALGHTVAGTASTAEEAIALAASADLVLMDIRIDGGRDGIEAASEIRARFRVPVVFLTAHADRSTLERAKVATPYGYIVKPLGPAALQASIEIAVYKHAMERQIEEREAWLRTTVSSAAEAIIAADRQGLVLLMNAAAEELTGRSQAEARNKPLDEVLLLMDGAGKAARDLDTLAILEDASTPLPSGLEAVSNSGRRFAVEGTIAPVRTSSGTAGVVVCLHDVSAQRWQERRLRQAQRMEAAGRLAAGVATDYANLVGVIRNQAGQLLTQFGEYSPARRSLEEIHQAAFTADQITKRLEAFGTRQPVQPEMVSLNGVVKRLTKLIESVAAGKIKVTVHAKPGAGRIRIDAAHLEQAVMTVVMHACSVTPPGGTLVMETGVVEAEGSRGERCASLRLTYSWMEEDAERLFEPSESRDAGLSLAVAQSMIAEQGGVITARALSQGTEVQILLPLAEESEMAAAAPVNAPSIVLVDSRERIRARLHNAAEAAGYNLLEAANREEAVTLCEMHSRPINILVAAVEDADAVVAALDTAHQPRTVLRLVAGSARSLEELETPFTQRAMLDRIALLVGSDQPRVEAATSS